MGQNIRQPRTKAEGSSGESAGHEKWSLHGKCQRLMRVMTHRVIKANASLFVYLYILPVNIFLWLFSYSFPSSDNRHCGDLSGGSRALGAASTSPASPASGRASGSVTSPTRTPPTWTRSGETQEMCQTFSRIMKIVSFCLPVRRGQYNLTFVFLTLPKWLKIFPIFDTKTFMIRISELNLLCQ